MKRVMVVGSINMDVVLRLRSPLLPGETQLAREVQWHAGGKGANQAVAAGRLGAEVHMVGAVGSDEEGATLLTGLADHGVNTAGCVVLAGETGKAYIMSASSGENSIVVVQGANAELGPSHLAPLDGLGTGDVVVCQLEIPLETARLALVSARARGATTVLNAAPAADIRPLIESTDVLVVNETEAEQATRLFGGSAQTPLAMTEYLAGCGPATVITTLGEQGLVACFEGKTLQMPAVHVDARDTTGAGDTFVGALAAELAAGVSLPNALRTASYAGALACTRLGAQEGMPDRTELLEFQQRSAIDSEIAAM